MKFKNFIDCSKINGLIPNVPGLYCLKIKNVNSFSKKFLKVISNKNNIVYIGKTTSSISKRLEEELRARRHGTFFRSIGCILGYRPPEGSLIGRINSNNFKFSKKDNLKIIDWINRNLCVAWIEKNNNLSNLETSLIKEYKPSINLIHNEGLSINFIRELREECRKIANSIN